MIDPIYKQLIVLGTIFLVWMIVFLYLFGGKKHQTKQPRKQDLTLIDIEQECDVDLIYQTAKHVKNKREKNDN